MIVYVGIGCYSDLDQSRSNNVRLLFCWEMPTKYATYCQSICTSQSKRNRKQRKVKNYIHITILVLYYYYYYYFIQYQAAIFVFFWFSTFKVPVVQYTTPIPHQDPIKNGNSLWEYQILLVVFLSRWLSLILFLCCGAGNRHRKAQLYGILRRERRNTEKK